VRFRPFTVVSLALVLLPAAAGAQDFGVLNSAETINRGNFKLTGAPMLVSGRPEIGDEVGVSVSGGYGVTDEVDVEARVSFFDDVKFFGGDVEYWFVKNRALDVSIAGGFHFGNSDHRFDTTGFDLTFLASGHVAPKLELYGGLDLAFESFTDDFIDDDFTTAHLVPGIEYRVAPDIDLVAEFGIGLNDDSYHYLAGGVAFYFR
jgi:hypothetical protein